MLFSDLTASQVPALFAMREADSHKGTFGTLGILGGAPSMSGAVVLAARAALYLGTGKVYVGFAQDSAPLPCDLLHPELMLDTAQALLEKHQLVSAWVAGCGLGTTRQAVGLLSRLLGESNPHAVVLDADGLNLLALGAIDLAHTVGDIVLTPHPAEAARLLGCSTRDIQSDRAAAAQALATRYPRAWIVLKGAGTLIVSPSGQHGAWRNTSGNPGLATAGSGDVLAGMLGALIAQGLPLAQAVPAGVWLHGAAADALVSQGVGPIGMTAGELAPAARHLRNHPPT